jgi:hypothetical protein
MQSRQMRKKNKKASQTAGQQTSSGLVPYGGYPQQSSASASIYGSTPSQYQYSSPMQIPPAHHHHAYLDSKPSIDSMSGWTAVHKTETVYYMQDGRPYSTDSKIQSPSPTPSRHSLSLSPPVSPMPSPLPSPAVPAAPHLLQHQQSQLRQQTQAPNYVPGQGQVGGFWSPHVQPGLSSPAPPSYQSAVNQAPKRHHLRPWKN